VASEGKERVDHSTMEKSTSKDLFYGRRRRLQTGDIFHGPKRRVGRIAGSGKKRERFSVPEVKGVATKGAGQARE